MGMYVGMTFLLAFNVFDIVSRAILVLYRRRQKKRQRRQRHVVRHPYQDVFAEYLVPYWRVPLLDRSSVRKGNAQKQQ